MKVILKGYIEIPESDALSVTNELPRHIELTRNEPGCIVFSVEQDQINPYKYTVHEEFLDREALDAHQQRVKDSNWGKVSKNLLRHYEIVEE